MSLLLEYFFGFTLWVLGGSWLDFKNKYQSNFATIFTRLLVAIIGKEKINSKNYRKHACTNGWPPIGWFLKISTLKRCSETGEQKKSPNFRKTHPFEEKLSCWISLVPKVRPGGRVRRKMSWFRWLRLASTEARKKLGNSARMTGLLFFW